ncbi:MAG: hypothetical protein IT353_13285 [Gemmatimonadaceae bacterium]|nr:hypothetical protein [Gemmatimonadaceae bacterium]
MRHANRHANRRAALPTLYLAFIAVIGMSGCIGRRASSGRVPPAPPSAADSTAAPPTVTADSAARVAKSDYARATAARADSAAADSSKAAARDTSTTPGATAAKPAARRAPPPKPCVLDLAESPPESRFILKRLPDSTSLTFIGGGFVGHCQGDKNRIRADSAEHYQASGIINLFGNVVYEEPGKMRLDAQTARYFTKEERMFAEGNVVATQVASGSTFRGSSIEYLRPLAGSRTTSRLIAPNRPTVLIIEKDSTGKPGSPVSLVANTMVDEGDSLLFAWGEVQINRSTIMGESDSASFDKVTERARLIRTARIINRDPKQPFRLFADTIDLFSKDSVLERVVALHNANASNADVVMQAERLDLRFVEQKLDRAYAFGPGRAKATTSSQTLVADSIYILMPDQRVREVQAIGMAVATGNPDTLKIKSEDRDILRGDTVIAWFDTVTSPADTSERARIREIRAKGSASSLFQIASKQGPSAPPGLNYVRGKRIHVVFDSGQVRDVTVDSAASGLYLEPAPDSLADSTKRPPAAPPRRPPAPESPEAPEFPRGAASVALLASPDPRRRP